MSEERWQTALRVAVDDHPEDCGCSRDHLKNAFLHGAQAARAVVESWGLDAPRVHDIATLRAALPKEGTDG